VSAAGTTSLTDTASSAVAGLATVVTSALGPARGISDRAATVQQATQYVGGALSVARNTMPQPLGDPTGLAVAGALTGAGVGAAIGGVLGAGAGGIGAAGLFLTNVVAADRNADAVYVMSRYESSLRGTAP
jgi:phage-related minor tail protein